MLDIDVTSCRYMVPSNFWFSSKVFSHFISLSRVLFGPPGLFPLLEWWKSIPSERLSVSTLHTKRYYILWTRSQFFGLSTLVPFAFYYFVSFHFQQQFYVCFYFYKVALTTKSTEHGNLFKMFFLSSVWV